MLLRITIGWHFHYEGLWKVESLKTSKPFTAEGYLRNATGPFAPFFRDMVPDVDGLQSLDPISYKASLHAQVRLVSEHFGFNDEQAAKGKAEVDAATAFADDWFASRDNRERIEKYVHDLEAVRKVEANPNALETEKTWAWSQRKVLDRDRKDLLSELEARRDDLRESLLKLATPEQVASAGEYAPPPTSLQINDQVTAYGLMAIGLCLMLGLLTRFAAISGAAFLALVYLAMPPWPGMPENPTDPGHYLFIDKNAVEMMACLALAALPTGHWVGLDALLFGWLRRWRHSEVSRS
ncbi:MAG: DoxX family protein [Isosphaeraceae bacterium]